MSGKFVSLVLPVVVAIGALSFFPAKIVQAYPIACDRNFETCMAQATTIQQRVICNKAFELCSGGAIPPNAVGAPLAVRKEP